MNLIFFKPVARLVTLAFGLSLVLPTDFSTWTLQLSNFNFGTTEAQARVKHKSVSYHAGKKLTHKNTSHRLKGKKNVKSAKLKKHAKNSLKAKLKNKKKTHRKVANRSGLRNSKATRHAGLKKNKHARRIASLPHETVSERHAKTHNAKGVSHGSKKVKRHSFRQQQAATF